MNDRVPPSQYRALAAKSALFAANGVILDVEPRLFVAGHGNSDPSLRAGEAGIVTRQVPEMDDADARQQPPRRGAALVGEDIDPRCPERRCSTTTPS